MENGISSSLKHFISKVTNRPIVMENDSYVYFDNIEEKVSSEVIAEAEVLLNEEIEKQEQARLKAEKEEALRTLTVTTSNGNTFDANLEARTNMNNAISASKYLGRTEAEWKLADNSVILIQLPELEEASALAILAVGNIVTQY